MINNVLILFLGSSLLIVPVIVSGLISSLLIVVLYLLILSAVGLALLIALFKSCLFKGKGLSGYLSHRSVILLAGSLIILVIVLVVRLVAVRPVAVLLLIFLTGLFGCFRIYIIVIDCIFSLLPAESCGGNSLGGKSGAAERLLVSAVGSVICRSIVSCCVFRFFRLRSNSFAVLVNGDIVSLILVF